MGRLSALIVALLLTASGAEAGHRVFRVIDGDTLVLGNGDNVRLRGVNSPELGEAAADAATDFARSFAEGREAELDHGKGVDGQPLPPARDGYGRLLADVVVDGQSLSEALLREGHAHVFVIPPTPLDMERRLVELQVQARRRKKGIWSTPRFQGALHITSMHADAPGDDRENLNGEYLRIANVGTRPAALGGVTLQNHRGMRLTFPDATLPVGHTVMVFTGTGEDRLDSALGPLQVYWRLTEPAWGNRGDRAILRSARGRIEDDLEFKPKRPFGGRKH